MKKTSPSEPRWITAFFTASLLLAAMTTLAALVFGGRSGHLVHDGVVADITVNLNGIPVREHCTTCHVQGGPSSHREIKYAGDRHPDIAPHDWRALGCTGCHLGEGMALDRAISHGLPGLGARRVLTGRDVQGRCYACHEPAPLKGAEKPWRGYRLFLTSACDSCHRIEPFAPGGSYGPDISTIGSTLGLEQLQKTIREPAQEPINSIMPRFPLSRGQVREIAWFLKSRVRDPAYATPMVLRTREASLPPLEMPIPESLPSNARLLATAKCLACHKFGEEDGGVGPDLTWIGSMQSREYLSAFLVNPDLKIPGAIMPRTVGGESESRELVAFLAEQAVGPLSPTAHADAREPREGNAPKIRYMMLCQRCHAANGDGHGRIEANLARFPRPFAGNAEFFRRADDERLVGSVDKGIPGTSMPPYGGLLSRREISELVDLIFTAFIGAPRHEKDDPTPLPEPPLIRPNVSEAQDLYRRLCMRCHGSHGTGRGPEYLEHLPRPRNLNNTPYFASLPDERIARSIVDGVPGTAMAAFGSRLSARELWGFVEMVRRFSQEKKP